MAQCSVCRKTLRERLLNWREDKGPFGFEVVAKIGASSYKCVCNRCGHIWDSKTKDAALQFNEPEKHLQQKRSIEESLSQIEKYYENSDVIFIYPLQLGD
jgi:hypothetical protein